MGSVQFLISTPLVLEYEEVLTRREHLKASGLSAGEVQELLNAICAVGTEVAMTRSLRPQLHDPDDEMVLETAVNGGADAIFTFNLADFAGIEDLFGVEAITPQQALKRMGFQ